MCHIQLHCPSTSKTLDNFVIGAYQKPEQVLQGVRLALDLKFAALYTVDAKPISDPSKTLQDNERVLVAASATETMLPDAAYGYAMYAGEEGEDVDIDVEGYGMDWQDLIDREKAAHILSLVETKPSTRNKLRITRECGAVREDLAAITQQELDTTPASTTDSETLIEERWDINLDAFLKQNTKHVAALATKSHLTSSSLSPSTVSALAVFSSMTLGQPRLASEVLSEAFVMRLDKEEGEAKDPVLREDDVKNAVEIVYERAGVVPAKLTKAKTGKTKDRKRAKGKGKNGGGSAGL
ncbi:hypothetical protein COCMIDRAFT_8540 [Bipolaris oryzae ATCC 44560]|uniref:Uncharacterized protein n=1 Tax=Bipolaris oryzae ATCC 44560 TaxID=930090 RepID=W6ZE41_COCMI|nr:uncharacterized protein COCMIDRAFT_8540 [Bipolaris oryzae ATCC 44560]EUC41786.1 hypothetical protein COCMIDRAFT_8540 [Bipolaris oryzae ATCC 44560]